MRVGVDQRLAVLARDVEVQRRELVVESVGRPGALLPSDDPLLLLQRVWSHDSMRIRMRREIR